MPGWNPEPSAIGIARMLNRHVPAVRLTPTPVIKSTAPPLRRDMGGGVPGGIPDSPSTPFTGPIYHPSGGRDDDIAMHVRPGSYVLPADVVGQVGQGNSMNGLSLLRMMFGPWPYNAQSGPYGTPMPAKMRGPGPPPLHKPAIKGFPSFQIGPGVAQNVVRPEKHGGAVHPGEPGSDFLQRMGVSTQKHGTPIMASGGEFVISPDEVARRGGGDLNKGHKVLDAWVKSMRAQHIKTLQKLPGPAQ